MNKVIHSVHVEKAVEVCENVEKWPTWLLYFGDKMENDEKMFNQKKVFDKIVSLSGSWLDVRSRVGL